MLVTSTAKFSGGLAMVAVSIGGLFWNEGVFVRQYVSLDEGSAGVVELTVNSTKEAIESKLVHVIGNLTAQDGRSKPFVMDAEFGVATAGVYLDRIVEMLQWKEVSHYHTDNKGNHKTTYTTYTYTMEWSATVIDSNKFHDHSYVNPTQWAITSRRITAPSVLLQGYRVSDDLLGQIISRNPVSLDPASLQQMDAILNTSFNVHQGIDAIPALKTMEIREDVYYTKHASGSSQWNLWAFQLVGDQRVRFEVTPADTVSVLAMPLSDGGLHPFTTSSGDAIALLEEGVVDAGTLLDDALFWLMVRTWLFRLAGFVLGALGFFVVMWSLDDSVVLLVSSSVAASWGVGSYCATCGLLGVSTVLVVVAITWMWLWPWHAFFLAGAAVIPHIPMPKRYEWWHRDDNEEGKHILHDEPH